MNQAARLFVALSACLFATTAQAQVLAKLRLEAVDPVGGNPISQVTVGEEFRLNAYVQDGRQDPDFPGVFAAFIDLPFNPSLATALEPFTHGDFFNLITEGTVSPGLLYNAGGVTSQSTPPGLAEQFLFSIVFRADGAGQLVLTPQFPSDPFGEWGVYGHDDPLLPEQVFLTGTSVTIVPEPSSVVLAGCAAATLGLMLYRRRARKRA